MLATGGAAPPTRRGRRTTWQEWDASALAALDVPVIQARLRDLVAATLGGVRRGPDAAGRRDAGRDPGVRRPPASAASISFKERDAEDSPVGVPVPRYVARPRALRAASRASRSRTRGCAHAGRASGGSPSC